MRRYRKPNHYLQLAHSHRPNASAQALSMSARTSDHRAVETAMEHQKPFAKKVIDVSLELAQARRLGRRALTQQLEQQVPKPTFGHRKEGTKGFRPIKAKSSGKGMTKALRLTPASVSGPAGGMGWFSRQIKPLASAPHPARTSNWDRLPSIYRSQLYGYSRRYDL